MDPHNMLLDTLDRLDKANLLDKVSIDAKSYWANARSDYYKRLQEQTTAREKEQAKHRLRTQAIAKLNTAERRVLGLDGGDGK